jgi:predicted N-formylglutamate amidohydrolase
MKLLQEGDLAPATVHRTGAPAPFLFTCDHAGRAIPRALGDLGVAPADLSRHIGWDIGAAELTLRLAEGFNACAILQTYSRLVIDCNRHPSRRDAIPEVSDGVRIPANARMGWEEREARIAEVHRPYHAAIAAELDARAARGLQTSLILIHSFTPSMGGVARPWQVGVLHQGNALSRRALAWLGRRHELTVGDNEPYAMDEIDYTAPLHAQRRGLEYLELETRQDLIAEAAGQDRFAGLYAEMLRAL